MTGKSDQAKSGFTKSQRDTVYFLDQDGFSANCRDSHWFFQKFDTAEQIKEIAALLGKAEIYKVGTSWQICATKFGNPKLHEEIIQALRFEWDMPLPKGSYGLSDEIEKAYRHAVPSN